jgi:hypothetical protein
MAGCQADPQRPPLDVDWISHPEQLEGAVVHLRLCVPRQARWVWGPPLPSPFPFALYVCGLTMSRQACVVAVVIVKQLFDTVCSYDVIQVHFRCLRSSLLCPSSMAACRVHRHCRCDLGSHTYARCFGQFALCLLNHWLAPTILPLCLLNRWLAPTMHLVLAQPLVGPIQCCTGFGDTIV